MSIKFVTSVCLIHPANTSTRAFTLTALIPRYRFHTCYVRRTFQYVFMRAFQLTFKRSQSAGEALLFNKTLSATDFRSIILRFVLIKTFIPSRGLPAIHKEASRPQMSVIHREPGPEKPNGSIDFLYYLCVTMSII